MQSGMDSWQFEKFSTAELSPPISPAPPSPTLYHHVNSAPLSPTSEICFDKDISAFQAQKVLLQDQDPKMQQMVNRRSRAQVATNILKDLEQLGDMESKNEIGLGGDWIEESVNNMELFEELSEVAYIPDSPGMSFDDQRSQSPLAPVSSPSHLSEQSMLHTQGLQEPYTLSSGYEREDFDQLKAEFEAILESLPTDSSSYGEVIDIIGIPTTLVGDEEMISFDLADESIVNDMGVEMEMEVSSSDDTSVLLVDEEDVFQIEGEELNASAGSYDYESYMASSPENCVSEDDDDIQANTAEKILDALLQGNIQAAEAYIPVEVKVESRIVPLSIEDDSSRCSSISEVQTVVINKNKRNTPKAVEVKSPKKAKTEKRGRKPGSNKKSMAFLTDKALRKKEQNKTAATRYRQKKKQETNCTLEAEQKLQNEHDELAKQKEDLHRQILMIKQLLREVVSAKKSQVQKRVSTNRRKL